MAKVKIQGNASGTGVFTIEAPGTNDPRTLTLPDATGTLLNSDGDGSSLTSLPAHTGNVAFPATQVASADVNTLDDYEEGTWTPTVGGDATYHGQYGWYTKIGRYIYLSCHMHILSLGTGSTTTVSGFPFSISLQDGSVNRFANLATNVINLMPTTTFTSTNFCATTASAGTVTDTVAVFGTSSATQLNFALVGHIN